MSGYDLLTPDDIFSYAYSVSSDGIIISQELNGGQKQFFLRAVAQTQDYHGICDVEDIDAARLCTTVGKYFFFEQAKAEAFIAGENAQHPGANSLVSGRVVFKDAAGATAARAGGCLGGDTALYLPE